MQLSLYHFVRDFHEHFGIDIIKYVSRISGHREWLRLHERMALSRREASLTAARARRSRDHSGTVSVQYKLPSPYVLVSPSPVSREASRDLWRSIGLSTMVVFQLRTIL